jgi:hypothetical protein
VGPARGKLRKRALRGIAAGGHGLVRAGVAAQVMPLTILRANDNHLPYPIRHNLWLLLCDSEDLRRVEKVANRLNANENTL